MGFEEVNDLSKDLEEAKLATGPRRPDPTPGRWATSLPSPVCCELCFCGHLRSSASTHPGSTGAPQQSLPPGLASMAPEAWESRCRPWRVLGLLGPESIHHPPPPPTSGRASWTSPSRLPQQHPVLPMSSCLPEVCSSDHSQSHPRK